MMIGDRQECLDKIGSYLRAGVTHFLFVSARRIEEVCRFAEEVIPAARTA